MAQVESSRLRRMISHSAWARDGVRGKAVASPLACQRVVPDTVSHDERADRHYLAGWKTIAAERGSFA